MTIQIAVSNNMAVVLSIGAICLTYAFCYVVERITR